MTKAQKKANNRKKIQKESRKALYKKGLFGKKC